MSAGRGVAAGRSRGLTGRRSVAAGRRMIAVVVFALVPALFAGVLPGGAAVQPVTFPVESALAGAELTPAGYRKFVRSIDRSQLAFATSFVEFDHKRVPIPQGRSEVFVWHFTATYYDKDGWTTEPRGRTSVRRFVRMIAGRGDSIGDRRCCGVNWFMTKDGRVFQLAAINAKLRHNPPYDSINTGVEVEAFTQEDISPRQYEQLAYLTIYTLKRQGLLGQGPLRRVVRGHGEMRDAYLERNPGRYAGRDDFDAPVCDLLRRKIVRFLRQHPQIGR